MVTYSMSATEPGLDLKSSYTRFMIPFIQICWKWEKVLSRIRWLLLHFYSQICIWKCEFIWPSCQVADDRQLHYFSESHRESEIILPFTFRGVLLSPTLCTRIPELCASCWSCLHFLAAVSPDAPPLPFLASCSRETLTSWLPYLFTSFVPALTQALRGNWIERTKSRGIQWIIKSPIRIPGVRCLRTTWWLPCK